MKEPRKPERAVKNPACPRPVAAPMTPIPRVTKTCDNSTPVVAPRMAPMMGGMEPTRKATGVMVKQTLRDSRKRLTSGMSMTKPAQEPAFKKTASIKVIVGVSFVSDNTVANPPLFPIVMQTAIMEIMKKNGIVIQLMMDIYLTPLIALNIIRPQTTADTMHCQGCKLAKVAENAGENGRLDRHGLPDIKSNSYRIDRNPHSDEFCIDLYAKE